MMTDTQPSTTGTQHGSDTLEHAGTAADRALSVLPTFWSVEATSALTASAGTLQEGETGDAAPQHAAASGNAAAAGEAVAMPVQAEDAAIQQDEHAMGMGADAVADAAEQQHS